MYGKPNHLGGGTQADIDLVELDVFNIDDGELLTDSQLSVFWDVDLGTHTSIEIRYYVRFQEDGDWYELPYRNDGTGELASVPSEVGATTPAKFVDSLPLPACVDFKATVKGVGGLNGSATANAMGRDN